MLRFLVIKMLVYKRYSDKSVKIIDTSKASVIKLNKTGIRITFNEKEEAFLFEKEISVEKLDSLTELFIRCKDSPVILYLNDFLDEEVKD